jgi:tRNA A58 N-methylase Trm61
MENRVEEIVNQMLLPNFPNARRTQLIQTAHRLKIVEHWGIQPGEQLLEIGNGQGDMTIVLAEVVGTDGSVTGVDIAPTTYGAPFTVGEGIAHIKNQPLGKNVEVFFQTNILKDDAVIKAKAFDAVVFATSSWYFSSLEELKALFKKARELGKRIYYSEFT